MKTVDIKLGDLTVEQRTVLLAQVRAEDAKALQAKRKTAARKAAVTRKEKWRAEVKRHREEEQAFLIENMPKLPALMAHIGPTLLSWHAFGLAYEALHEGLPHDAEVPQDDIDALARKFDIPQALITSAPEISIELDRLAGAMRDMVLTVRLAPKAVALLQAVAMKEPS